MSDTLWFRVIGIDGKGYAYNIPIQAGDWVDAARQAIRIEVLRHGPVKAIKLEGGT